MKLKDLLKQLEGLDPDTEIYKASNEDDDGEILLSHDISIRNIWAIKHPLFEDCLLIPNHTVCKIHDPLEVWVLE